MPFHFNQYSSLLLVVIAPALLYAGLLLYRGYDRETLSDKLVGWLVFLFALQSTAWMLGFAGYYDQSAKTIFMFYFPWQHSFLYGPLVYLFFRSLSDRDFQLWRTPNWYHLIPGGIFLLGEVLTIGHDFLIAQVHLMEVIPNDLDLQPGVWLSGMPEWTYIPIEILRYLSLLGYFIYTLIAYRRYRAYLQTNFSNEDLVHLRWLRNFLAFFLILIVAVPIIEILADSIQGMTSYEFNWYGYLLYGLIAYYLGFHAYANDPVNYRKLTFGHAESVHPVKEVAAPLLDETVETLHENPITANAATETDEAEVAAHFAGIERALSEDQLYLQPTLSLQDLAQAVRLSGHEVSAAINRKAQRNFNHYINGWRVKAVQERIVDPAFSHLSLLGIGLDAGFSSKATFNRAFKQHTGMTPREFRDASL